ncbi:MAG: hypothetical protein DRN16_02415 [Thermoplasmata archaeon]|nr:MAG: hypothetical protein DRN16_02415 [Thermoplasmata archaeon]
MLSLGSSATGNTWFRHLFVHKYVDPAPSWFSFGTWQSLGNTPPTVSNPFPSNGSTDVDVTLSQLSVDISDPDGDTMTWTIETSPNIGNNSGSSGNGTITCSISGLQYSTTYTWYVNVSDGDGGVANKTYTFTTRAQYIPDPPTGFTATANGRFQIDLSWTKGSNADKTVIVFKTTGYPTSVSDETTVYNDTGTSYSHTGLTPGTTYYYSAWSWNNTDNVYSSSYTTTSNTTDSNNPPSLSSENPANGSTNQELSLTWSISITDADGDNIDWSIECSNGQNNSGTNEAGGTKSLSISGLSYNTEYKVWVNATDGYDWTREWYTFTTRAEYTPDPPSSFTATTYNSTRIDLSWTKGSGADYTYVERNTVASWSKGAGVLVYNDTGTSYGDTGLNAGTTYYYQAWSYNITDNAYSTSYASASNLTKPEPPVFLGVKKTDEDMYW